MRRVSRALKSKAISSLKRGAGAFNGMDDDGRQTAVLLHLQHAHEMLLKAALRERGIDVFERSPRRSVGRSIGYEKCVRLAREHLGLSEDQQGTLRAIASMRDDEQHWIADPAKVCSTRPCGRPPSDQRRPAYKLSAFALC